MDSILRIKSLRQAKQIYPIKENGHHKHNFSDEEVASLKRAFVAFLWDNNMLFEYLRAVIKVGPWMENYPAMFDITPRHWIITSFSWGLAEAKGLGSYADWEKLSKDWISIMELTEFSW